MVPVRDDEVVLQVKALMPRLPGAAVRDLMNDLEEKHGRGERGQAIRRIIVDELNRRRPNRAQRLFTSLVEPLLVDDEIMIRAPGFVPGLLTRLDVGVMWDYLRKAALADLARDAQSRLDEICRTDPIERALMSPTALELRNRMRLAAVTHLDVTLRNRRGLDDVIEPLSATAFKVAKAKYPTLVEKHKLEAPFLRFFSDLLTNHEIVVSTVDEAVARYGHRAMQSGQLDEQFDGIQSMQSEIGLALVDLLGSRGAMMKGLPSYTLINRLERYDFGGRVVRAFPESPPAEVALTLDVMLCHFGAACRTVAEHLTAATTVGQGEMVAHLLIPDAIRSILDEALKRFAAILRELADVGVFGERGLEARYRYAMTAASNVIVGPVMHLAIDRTRAVANDRLSTAPDIDGVCWLLNFTFRWSQELISLGFAADDLVEFQRTLRREIHNGFTGAIRFEPEEEKGPRLRHLVRLERLMNAMEGSIAEWFTALSQQLQKVMIWGIDRPLIRNDELQVINAYISLVQDQMTKARHFVAPELAEVIDVYERRLTEGFDVID
jgi:hypothetical protein